MAGLRPVQPRRTSAARLHGCARPGARPRGRRRVRRAARAPQRRSDRRVHLHHADLHDARGDVASPCASSSTSARTRSWRSRHPRATRRSTSVVRSAGDDDGDVSTDGPLTGVRVLELGNFIAGPFAGQLLGDYGADVIKVEAPGEGDPMRRWGARRDGDSLWWPTIARNKRSVVLDLKQASAPAHRARPGRPLRRGARELPAGRARQVGPRLRRPQGGQPRAGARARERVRADRTAGGPSGVRQRRRGDGRHPPHDREPRPSAVARRHQPGRLVGLGVRA